MRPDIVVGATFPDYELPDHTGRRRKLSELQGTDPMILVLSRGHFCPKDRRQLRNLVELHPEIRVAYTRLVTISTDNLLETNEMRDALGAGWPFLSDPGRTIQKDLDIAEYTDPRHDPMVPHTFVLVRASARCRRSDRGGHLVARHRPWLGTGHGQPRLPGSRNRGAASGIAPRATRVLVRRGGLDFIRLRRAQRRTRVHSSRSARQGTAMNAVPSRWTGVWS